MSDAPARLLRGELVRLTALQPDDTGVMAGWQGDAQFLRFYDAEPAFPKTAQQLTSYVAEQQRSNTAFLFAIRPVDGDDLLGMVELDGILWNQGTGWVSIAIGDAAQRGQGFGAEAMRLLLDFAFDELNLRRVQLTVFRYNPTAIRLYEKLGFVQEGVFREFLQRNGQVHDMLLYGLLRREWEGNRE